MMKLLLCILSLLSVYAFPSGFTTLKEFTDYAERMPEYPENDTTDWQNPDYTSFHKQIMPTFKKRLISRLRLKPYTTFPVDSLVPLLDEVSQYLKKTVPEGRVVKKVSVDAGATFYIWGELNGAFHSLVRSLNELQRQGVLDNDLRIIKPLVHFVFAGDVVNKSPYLIETVFLILRLMQVNPRCEGRSHEKVFYLKGKREDRQEWLSSGLGRELRTRLVQDVAEKTPLTLAFSNFFNRLPLALYLMQEGQTTKAREAVRISYFGPDYSELDENSFLYFFDDYSKPVVSISQKAFQEHDISLKVRAYIYAGSDLKKRIRQRGLSLIAKKDVKTEWAVFSSPTGSSHRLYQFFDDAFVVLTAASKLSDWTLTLFRQDVRTLNGFVQDRPIYLLSGEVIPDERQQKVVELHKELTDLLAGNQLLKKNCTLAQNADKVAGLPTDKKPDQPISALQGGNFVIGSTMDFSKQFKSYNESLKLGLNLAIDRINKEGGVTGKKIQMIYLDDGYEPKKARANVEKLLNDIKTNVVLSSMGSPTLKAYLDLIAAKKLLVIFPNTGAFRLPELKYMVHLRTSYVENGHMIAQFVAKDLKDKKVAFFYQDDAWGKDLFKGAKYEFAKAGVTEFLDLPYISNSISFTQQAEELKRFNPDGVAFFCSPRVCQEFIKEVGVEFLQRKILFGDTVLGLSDFSAYLKEKGLQMIRLQVMPNPEMSQLEIVKEFRDYAVKANVPLSTIALEGYINAAVFLDIMNKIKDDVSIDNFIKAVEGIKDYDFKGLKLNFDPNTRQLLHTVWMNSDEGDWPAQGIAIGKPVYDTKDEPAAKAVSAEPQGVSETGASELQKKVPEQLSIEGDKSTSLQGDTFVIGSSMDLSKQFKTYNESLKAGLNLPIDKINKEGGIAGKKIRMIYLDDGYDPVKARANIETFINEIKTNVTLTPMGTPAITGYLDLIKDRKIFAIFPNTGAFHVPELKYMVHLRTSYIENGHMIAQFVAKDLKDKKIAFFYQNDAWGKDLFKGAKDEFAKAGITEFLDLPYISNSISFVQQAEQLKKFNPDAVALFCSPRVCQEFIKEVGVEYLRKKILLGDNVLGRNDFSDYLKEKGLRMIRLLVVPNPQTSQLEIVKDFRDYAAQANVPIDTLALEGYINAAVFLDIMDKIKDDFSIESFIKAVEGIKDYNFKGLKLNFDPQTRQLLHTVWINVGSNDWLAQEVVIDKAAYEKEDESAAASPLAGAAVASGEAQSAVVIKALAEQKKAQERLKSEDDTLSSLQGNILKIGSTMDLSKGVKGLSDGYKGGMMLKLEEINASGGINGINFQLNVPDDLYEPPRARANVLELVKNLNIDLLLAPLGTPTTKAYLDLIEQGKVLALFPIARSVEFRRPDLINIIQYQMSLKQEAYTITRYIYEKFKPKKMVVFYQNDDFGIEPKDEIERLVKTELSDMELLVVPYERNNVNFKEQIAKIKNFKPDAIALQATSSVVEEFVRQAGAGFLYGKILFGGSWLMVDQFLKSMRDKGLDVNLISSMPDPITSEIELAQEFRKAAQGKNVSINVIYFEGYLYMSLLAHAMKQIEAPYSKEKIINVFQEMKNYDFKGLKLSFNPETRVILQNAWIYSTKENSWAQRSIAEVNENQKSIAPESEKKIMLPEPKKEVTKDEPVKTAPKKSAELKKDEAKQDEALLKSKTPEETKGLEAVVAKAVPQELTGDVNKEGMVVQNSTIVVGTTIPLTGGAKMYGNNVRDGLSLEINRVNQAGGVKNKTINLVVLDDEYKPQKIGDNINLLMSQYKTDILLSPFGDPSVAVEIEPVIQGKELVLFPNSHVPASVRYVVYARASYVQQTEVLVDYIIKQNVKKMAIIYPTGAWGTGAVEAAKKILVAAGKNESDYAFIPVVGTEIDLKKVIEEIKKFNPDAIGFFILSIQVQEFISRIGLEWIGGRKLFGINTLSEPKLAFFLQEKGLSIIVSQTVPNPLTSDLEIVKEYRKLADEKGLSVNIISLEAFINASIFVDSLRRLEKPINKENLITLIENTKNYDFKGLKLDFNEKTRGLLNSVWINAGGPEWERVELKNSK